MTVQIKPETEAAIRARAHQIWEEEGRPDGLHDVHWQRAYEAIVPATSPTVAAPGDLLAVKPPRAKTDQAKAAKKK